MPRQEEGSHLVRKPRGIPQSVIPTQILPRVRLRPWLHNKLGSWLCLLLLDSVHHDWLISPDGTSFKNHLHLDLYPRVYFQRIRITWRDCSTQVPGSQVSGPRSSRSGRETWEFILLTRSEVMVISMFYLSHCDSSFVDNLTQDTFIKKWSVTFIANPNPIL